MRVSTSDPTYQSRRSGAARSQGLTYKQLTSRRFVRPLHGVVRPAATSGDPLDLRLSDATALLGPTNALGGWAALRVQGNTWFDGVDRGAGEREILVHCLPGSQLRPRRGITPTRSDLLPDEIDHLENYAVATMARAAYDEMRLAVNVREAVVALDMAVSSTSGVAHTTIERVGRVVRSHHKTRGIVQARQALELGSNRSASPWETRTRLVAELDAGIEGLRVNAPVFDEFGRLLGVADLLDAEAGLIIESDGSMHREAERHAEDNRREEGFERVGAIVSRVSSLDHADRYGLAARLVDAYRHAQRLPRPRWQLEPPAWWATWTPAQRWQ